MKLKYVFFPIYIMYLVCKGYITIMLSFYIGARVIITKAIKLWG